MIKVVTATLALGFFVSTASLAHAACAALPGPCEIDEGTYHIALPEGEGPFPALVFLHGAGGSGEASIRGILRAVERGYAVIGPDGLPRPENNRRSWSFHPSFEPRRDEAAFLDAVIDDAAVQHRIDRTSVLIGGFSIGGSMATYLACDHPDLAAAFVPVAGSFWRPHPELDDCVGPVRLFHTHGWRDGTVPLEGRPIRNGEVLQGDVFYAMQVWRATNGCNGLKATQFETNAAFWRRSWPDCDAGALEFVLYPGGHGVPDGWTDMVLDWFEALATPPRE